MRYYRKILAEIDLTDFIDLFRCIIKAFDEKIPPWSISWNCNTFSFSFVENSGQKLTFKEKKTKYIL